uniref:Uncharacterized protein n=1 Tax=Meloidogyne enterolobii TaxID=390850 RepID=A0A6V7WSF4_MELEN|nr:unnamed protein product [Meloidogyne enterolobii]
MFGLKKLGSLGARRRDLGGGGGGEEIRGGEGGRREVIKIILVLSCYRPSFCFFPFSNKVHMDQRLL